MLTAGIVGLPNVGKSTLFNAMTKSKAVASNYPFSTKDPNVGIVLVEDPRLDKLAEIYKPKKVTPAAYEFIDIAGLARGASKGEGLGNQFLSHIREVDAICQVVRCFEDENVMHVDGSIDPVRDIETIQIELIMADLEVIDRRLSRLEKKLKLKVQEALQEHEILTQIKAVLEEYGNPRTLEFDPESLKLIKSFNLLTLKPMLYVANIGEADLMDPDNSTHLQNLLSYAKTLSIDVIPISAQVEAEIILLENDEQTQYLEAYGLKRPGLHEVIERSYKLLGLKTFFTAGEPEVRAWTFKEGMKAPECAGVIHSDFERGFIKAETMHFDDLMTYGTPHAAKEHGKVRLEGKEYLVKDGDIMLFRFNV